MSDPETLTDEEEFMRLDEKEEIEKIEKEIKLDKKKKNE